VRRAHLWGPVYRGGADRTHKPITKTPFTNPNQIITTTPIPPPNKTKNPIVDGHTPSTCGSTIQKEILGVGWLKRRSSQLNAVRFWISEGTGGPGLPRQGQSRTRGKRTCASVPATLPRQALGANGPDPPPPPPPEPPPRLPRGAPSHHPRAKDANGATHTHHHPPRLARETIAASTRNVRDTWQGQRQ